MSKRILLLEDDIERVSWLRKKFPAVSVEWVTSPGEFRRCYEAAKQTPASDHYALYILDHDLGLMLPGTYGGRELTGQDAAFLLSPDDKVLVWSANPDGAKRIAATARDRGAVATLIPFNPTSWFLENFIASTLS